tara:strand:+ start:244 stop:492 length:249 start_codon:yes stop_codon:yes gene_type:complete
MKRIFLLIFFLSPFANAERMSAEFFFGGMAWIIVITMVLACWFMYTKETVWQGNTTALVGLFVSWLYMMYFEDVMKYFGFFS